MQFAVFRGGVDAGVDRSFGALADPFAAARRSEVDAATQLQYNHHVAALDHIGSQSRRCTECRKCPYRTQIAEQVEFLTDSQELIDPSRLGRNERLWDREQEISYEVAAGQPVYAIEPHDDGNGSAVGGLIVRPQSYMPGYDFWEGIDFGYNWPYVVIAQLRPFYDGQGQYLHDGIHFLGVFTKPHSSTEELALALHEHNQEYFPGAKIRYACDYYGGNQRRSNNPKTDVEILRANGIVALCSAAPIKTGVELWQKLITLGRCEADPVTCASLITALRSGYTRTQDGEIPSTEAEKRDLHPAVDICDAGRYIIQQAFRFVNLNANREDSVRIPPPMQQPFRLIIRLRRGDRGCPPSRL